MSTAVAPGAAPEIRLALIDDHPIVVAGLEGMLARQDGVQLVTTAASVRDFTESWPTSFDVALLDLNIPGENYTDNIQTLRAKYPRMRLVAYTSYELPDLVREVLDLGCDGFLMKHITREELLRGVRSVHRGVEYVGTDAQQVRQHRATMRGSGNGADAHMRDDFQKRLLLSKREKEILHHISKGETSQQIADSLFISRYTVETHRKNILRKLDFNTSTELVKFAVLQGLV